MSLLFRRSLPMAVGRFSFSSAAPPCSPSRSARRRLIRRTRKSLFVVVVVVDRHRRGIRRTVSIYLIAYTRIPMNTRHPGNDTSVFVAVQQFKALVRPIRRADDLPRHTAAPRTTFIRILYIHIRTFFAEKKNTSFSVRLSTLVLLVFFNLSVKPSEQRSDDRHAFRVDTFIRHVVFRSFSRT